MIVYLYLSRFDQEVRHVSLKTVKLWYNVPLGLYKLLSNTTVCCKYQFAGGCSK